MQSLAKKSQDVGVFESINKDFKYKLGVIDFLTDYNSTKKLETTWNNMLHWKQREEISCQEPPLYANRFIRFLKENL